jgi:hypothetical protein
LTLLPSPFVEPGLPDESDEAKLELRLARSREVVQRGAEIGVFGAESLGRYSLFPAVELGSCFLRECEKETGVPRPQLLLHARRAEPLERVLADRLQHPEALARVAEEALVDERLQRVEVRFADLLGGFQRAAAGEDGKPPEKRLLLRGEKVVAPLDRRA